MMRTALASLCRWAIRQSEPVAVDARCGGGHRGAMLITGGRQLRLVPSGYTGHHTAADPAGSAPGPARRARALGCRRDRYACHAPGQARRPHSTTPIPVTRGLPLTATKADGL
jgi:hypothetical protein